jgi:hypothetical protein
VKTRSLLVLAILPGLFLPGLVHADASIAQDSCVAVDCGPAEGWACSLNGFGGAWYGAPPHDPPRLNCIHPWEMKGGFYVTIDPGFCCYTVRYADELGEIIMEEKECFTSCGSTPVEERTWGAIKTTYKK